MRDNHCQSASYFRSEASNDTASIDIIIDQMLTNLALEDRESCSMDILEMREVMSKFKKLDETELNELSTELLAIDPYRRITFILSWLGNPKYRGTNFARMLNIVYDSHCDAKTEPRHVNRTVLHLFCLYARSRSSDAHTEEEVIQFKSNYFEMLIEELGTHFDRSVTAKDDFGWTPAHLISLGEKCDTLRSGEPDHIYSQLYDLFVKKHFRVVEEKDHNEASVVHYTAGTIMIESLKLLLEYYDEEMVNEEDIFGSTALHYSAFANNFETTRLLLEKGCNKEKKDCKGRTACDLAQLFGYGDIVKLLGEDVSLESDIFNCKDISSSSAPEDFDKVIEFLKQDTKESNIDVVYLSLLKSPVMGSNGYHDECIKEEALLVENEVIRMMKTFSEIYNRRLPCFAFEPKLRGSMSERTKRGPPDEFDFMLIMKNLSEIGQLTAIDNCKASLTVKKLRKVDMSDRPQEDDAGCYNFDHRDLQGMLDHSLKIEFIRSDVWKESMLKFVNFETTNVGICLNLVFNGPIYKILHISIDLIPSIILDIPVSMEVSIHWPVPLDFSHCKLYGLLRANYGDFDVSCTDYEDVLLKSLPNAARDAYVIGKAFGSDQFKWCGRKFRDMFKVSYIVKKALLISVRQHEDISKVSRHDWIKGIISALSNMEKYVQANDGHRCIFHTDKWTRTDNSEMILKFSTNEISKRFPRHPSA
ncbi:hypothetical protein CAPTEDRAFT_201414 [Capitella teleta]|uniref:Uncharacterized protein n=1 Tax=Capitella teleta TaxID=283909 RepID=R7TI85_CAPTE|nr:hypothetical protein CAPTEDRAFT_201414 [Capitella teleta]|eukprot:ELT93192.1 hypothetical protein CAPTEDRAFT_201414 [Capitella teleta]